MESEIDRVESVSPTTEQPSMKVAAIMEDSFRGINSEDVLKDYHFKTI
jgi:hypothetical protein